MCIFCENGEILMPILAIRTKCILHSSIYEFWNYLFYFCEFWKYIVHTCKEPAWSLHDLSSWIQNNIFFIVSPNFLLNWNFAKMHLTMCHFPLFWYRDQFHLPQSVVSYESRFKLLKNAWNSNIMMGFLQCYTVTHVPSRMVHGSVVISDAE